MQDQPTWIKKKKKSWIWGTTRSG